MVVEKLSDFKLGNYYDIVFNGKVIDSFLANNLDRCAIHLEAYTKRGCKIVECKA